MRSTNTVGTNTRAISHAGRPSDRSDHGQMQCNLALGFLEALLLQLAVAVARSLHRCIHILLYDGASSHLKHAALLCVTRSCEWNLGVVGHSHHKTWF